MRSYGTLLQPEGTQTNWPWCLQKCLSLLLIVTAVVFFAANCSSNAQFDSEQQRSQERYAAERQKMVELQIAARGVRDPRVLTAMGSVPRHLFVPPEFRERSYDDYPLPIGWGQTISQPYIVAFMTESLRLKSGDRVLEVGTGSGYQAAVLAKLVKDVYTVEIVEPLAKRAAADLKKLGYSNVHVRAGDGYRGWPEAAPFNAIMVTAAPDHVPQALVDQLVPGGRLILPVGEWSQSLVCLTKTDKGVKREELLPVQFVPMTGEAERRGR